MVRRRFVPWLALMFAVGASPSAAQFVPREALIPTERAAQQVVADHLAPTQAQFAQMGVLEREVRIEEACNMTSDPALEAPRRSLLRLYEDSYGPEHPAMARPLISLLCHLAYNAKTDADRAEREQIVARLIAIGRNRAQPAVLFVGLSAQSQLRLDQNAYEKAIAAATEALTLARRIFAGRPAIVASSAGALARAFDAASRPADAEPLLQEQVTLLQQISGDDPFALAAAYEALGNNLTRQARVSDAQSWYARELSLLEAALPATDTRHLDRIVAYSQQLFWTDAARVETLYHAVLARQEADPASSDKRNWMTLWNLAKSAFLRADTHSAIAYQRRVIAAIGSGPGGAFELGLADMLAQKPDTAGEAEAIYRRALAVDPDNPALIEKLGNTLWTLNRFDEAVPMRKRAVEIAIARFGPSHRETLRLVQNLGVALWIMRRPAEARPYYEHVLAGYRAELSAIPEAANADYRRNLSGFISSKASDLLKLYWASRANAAQGGEATSLAKGFAVAQLAHPSVSSAAISESAARALAARAGKGETFARWAAARDRVVSLDAAIGQAAQRGAQGDAERIRLLGERASAGTALAEMAAALQRQLPDLFATLRPEPVPLAEVGNGKAGLLRADEALVQLYPGIPDARGEMSRGIVFAVTRERSAWAEIAIDGADLARMVGELAGQLGDPQHSGLTGQRPGEDPGDYLRYDRDEAYRVYRALFGAPSIAPLLIGKTRWIVVPEGPLLALDFAALVSRPPEGGAAGDFDPATLRATNWLGLDRVLTVVPSVDAVRSARAHAKVGWSGGKFYGVGDPAFRGVADPVSAAMADCLNKGPVVASLAPRQQFYRGGVADPAMLATLGRLKCSAVEVESMAKLLGASPDRQLLQLNATQARLERSSADGTLGDSDIVLFATHALLGGSFDGTLAEPALALTPGSGGADGANDDGLLTASEIAQLRLNATLVILSACNTAAGVNGGDGFSGLARSFLLAGARTVLATYSPIVDEIGVRMTTSMVARLKRTHDIASALRDAMREIATDRSNDAKGESLAHPAAWAVYVAIDPS